MVCDASAVTGVLFIFLYSSASQNLLGLHSTLEFVKWMFWFRTTGRGLTSGTLGGA